MRVALIAGEASGDLLGAGLIRELRQRVDHVTFEGIAGPEMAAAGCEVLEPSESLALFGLVEPLAHIPRLLRLRRRLVQRWTSSPPDVFVGIDAPDFNLGLECRLRAKGVKTVHYVSPSVWAWRQGRVRKIARAVDRVLCLLPFEKKFYDDHGVAADFVGHPMADNIPTDLETAAVRESLGIVAPQVVAVLPGSRKSEVSRLGPLFAETCIELVSRHGDLRFVAPMASASLGRLFTEQLGKAGIADRFLLLEGNAQSAIASADVVLLASGTATLQTALLGKPMVAAYRFAASTYAIAYLFNLVNVAYFSLPNLLTDEPLVPEFLQNAATPLALAGAVDELLRDADRRAGIRLEFARLRSHLARGADRKAAQAVIEVAAGG